MDDFGWLLKGVVTILLFGLFGCLLGIALTFIDLYIREWRTRKRNKNNNN